MRTLQVVLWLYGLASVACGVAVLFHRREKRRAYRVERRPASNGYRWAAWQGQAGNN